MVRTSASAVRAGSRPCSPGVTLLAALALIPAARAPVTPGHGGADELLALRWTERGTVYPGGAPLALGIATGARPFVLARSESWPLAQGRTASRTMPIAPGGGWLVGGRRREPMPEAMLRRAAGGVPSQGQRIVVPGTGEGSVSTEFTLRGGRLIEARNSVDDSAKPGRAIAQLIRFGGGDLVSHGLRWPRRLEILQAGLRWFTLELETFAAAPAKAR